MVITRYRYILKFYITGYLNLWHGKNLELRSCGGSSSSSFSSSWKGKKGGVEKSSSSLFCQSSTLLYYPSLLFLLRYYLFSDFSSRLAKKQTQILFRKR